MESHLVKDESMLVVVRCVGLGISSKTEFHNQGILSNLYFMAVGKHTLKNEKRYIKISQSAPYKGPTGRPPK